MEKLTVGRPRMSDEEREQSKLKLKEYFRNYHLKNKEKLNNRRSYSSKHKNIIAKFDKDPELLAFVMEHYKNKNQDI